MPAAFAAGASKSRVSLRRWLVAACLGLFVSAGTASALTFEARVSASKDDAEQAADSTVTANSSDLELVHDVTDQIIGIRWATFTVPKGATITAAWIQFTAKESQSEVTSLLIRGQASDAATTFSSARLDVSSRPRTAASASWAPASWTSGQVGATQRTPSLVPIIQEIVNRTAWASGNPLAIIISGTGHRTAYAWDGSMPGAPLLHVEYTVASPPPDQPPVAQLTLSQAAVPSLVVTASGTGSTDTDGTPITSYRFDFGDGTPAVTMTAPALSTSHTYAAAGTYTVTLVVTDTGTLSSAPVTKTITVGPSDQPPVAQLALSQTTTPSLSVTASGVGSTDGDLTPIASYRFDFGDGTAPVVTTAATPSTSHTYATSGTYTVTLVVTDTGSLASSPVTKSISVLDPSAPPTFEVRIAASSDDAEQPGTGTVSLTSSDLELVHDGADQTIGMRWPGVAVPRGSTIVAAWIQFAAKESQTEVTNLVLRGQADDAPATFTAAAGSITARPLTAASATWSPVAWTAGQTGAEQRTPSLAPVIQEIVNRSGWASGNPLAIIVSGTGHRTAFAWDGSHPAAPLLHIEYTSSILPPPTDLPPAAQLALSQATTPSLSVTASGAGSTDGDLTPIASYQFDFGDGTPAVVTTAPTSSTSHTYAAAGTYTVTLVATDTGALVSPPVTQSITVAAPPPDQPPVAQLALSQATTPSLIVTASGAGSTDTDATPIASYQFDFGDGTTAVTTTAPTLSTSHTYAAAGTYTVTLVATDTGALGSAPVTQSITVAAPPPDQPPVAQLALSQATTPSLSVTASGAGSTDTDATPIASYRFDFGDGTPAVTTTAPTLSTSHTYAAAGTYTVTLVVTDTGSLASSPVTKSISVLGPSAPSTFEVRIAASSDDAEQPGTGTVSLTSSDLELVHDGADQTIGMRWPGVAVPRGSTIVAAWIQFAAKESQTEVTNLVLRGQAADAPATFTAAAGSITARPLTAASATWSPVAWTAGQTGAEQRTPSLAPVIQEIVNRSGWASGNPLAIIVSGTGHRTAFAWDGSHPAAPLLHIEYSTTPPTEMPPVAQLALSQATTPSFIVTASGAGSTDIDLTPIASYQFDFGDGTPAVVTTAPTSSTSHTYAAAGTYTVTLVATDTGALVSAPVTQSITVAAPPPDQPPVAQLALSQATTPSLSVTASGAGSTDTDATPIASYRFDFGDGTTAVTTTAPTLSTSHTYAAAGTYTVTLVVTDTGALASAPVTKSITVAAPSSGGNVAVYVGYYDTHHSGYTQPKPNPWLGSSGVTFVGKADDSSNNWDSSALRVDNLSGSSLSVVVTVDIGSNHFALWGSQTIPANGKLILAQTAFQNFDGSDTSPAGCYGCNPNLCLTQVVNTVPVVHVAIGSTTTNYYDNTQVLNTRGVDGAGCPYTGTRNDESQQWKQVGTTPSAAALAAGGESGWMPRGFENSAIALTPPVPNPARGMLLLRFGMASRSPMQLAVYDLAGRLVRMCLDTELDGGVYEKAVDLVGVRPGMYYAELRTPKYAVHRSFVVTL